MDSKARPQAIPSTPDELAIIVWDLLARSPQGLSRWEMEKLRPDLTKHQVKKGIARINRVFQETKEQPLICEAIRGRSMVYRLPEHCEDYKTYALRRLREYITRGTTELTRARAAVLNWPDDIPFFLPKLLGRVIEDLEEILSDLVDATREDEE